MTLRPITCAACGSSNFEHDAEDNLICSACGTKYASPRELIICPACGEENHPEARRCMNCGLVLGKTCAVCGHVNRPGLDHCEECASPLDVLSAVEERARGGGRQEGIVKQKLVQTKHQDMAYMQEQRARIDEEERQRRARLAQQRQESMKQQRMILTITLVGLAFLVLAVIVVLILSAGGPAA